MIFFRNELVRLVDEDQVKRILWISPTADAMVVVRVDAKVNMPEWVKRSDWEALAEAGKIESISEDKYLRLPAEGDLNKKARSRRDKAWEHIAALVASEPQIYVSDKRASMVRALEEAKAVHKDTVRNWLFEFWQKGMTKNALLPDWDKCGNRGERKKAGEAKRGRPRSVHPGTGINIGPEIQRIFEVAIANYYLRNKKATLKSAYRKMLRKFFSDAVEDGERGSLVLRDVDSIPTYEAFYYWYRTTRNEKREANARKGKRFYERTLRPLLGNSTDEALGPGFRYQIDATIADTYLVSKLNPTEIIGRPVVYVVIDVWSRLIVGIYVGIERPSWTAAVMALLNAASDKVEFCKQYGVEITPDEWPAAGLSSVILGDRGELESLLADRLAEVLDVKIENTPPYRADWKGIVERRFGLLQATFKPFVDGYIDVDYQERGGDDYRLDATLTLDDFTRVMIQSVLEHNETPIGGYPLSPAMIRDGVLETPNEIWAWGIKNRTGLLKTYDRDLLRFALMHTSKATVTESGIKFHNRNYACLHALERNWYSKARRGTWEVRVSYDPRCLDEILLHDPHDRRRFKVCKLIADDEEQYGLSLQELLSMQRKAKGTRGTNAHRTLELTLNREAEIERIVTEAKVRKSARGVDSRSKAERTGAIRENAEAERLERRKEEKFTFTPISTPESDNVVAIVPEKAKNFSMPTIFDLKKNK